MTTDQKRAIGIGAVGLAGLFLLSRRGTTGRSQTVQATSPTGSTTPFVPQAPVLVPAGESLYDPNSQNLLTPSGPPVAMSPLPLNIAPPASHPAYVVNVNYPKPVTRRSHAKRHTKRTPSVHRPTKPPHKTTTKTKAG